MRLLEQHNPDVDFDWPRLLKDASADQGARRDRDRDPRDRDRRERRDPRGAPRPRGLDTTAAAVPPAPPPAARETEADIADERAAAHAAVVLEQEPAEQEPDESVALSHGEPLAADHAEYVEYAEAAHVAPEESHEPSLHPAAARLGADGLARLRARYNQLVVRLADKPMDDELREQLNRQAERLNPDAWLTADEVAAALEQYESVFESLRAHVGNQPRRKL